MIAEWRLDGRKLLKLEARDEAPFRLVSMAGKSQLSLLRESLYSFGRLASLTPPLTILSDGTLDPSDFIAALSFWPDAIEVLNPNQVIDSIPEKIRILLEPLLAHPLGMKLAGVIALSAQGPLFFCDSDILWFSDPVHLLNQSFRKFSIAVTLEEGCSMNRRLAEKYAPELLSKSSANSGCILTNYDLSSEPLLPELLLLASENCENEFNEQTILGILSKLKGGFLAKELCLVAYNDAFDFRNRRAWRENYTSRHYVRFMRHQFYRDALKTKNLPS
jgi:hypothetical protein